MLHLILESLFRYYIDDLVENYVGPASKFIFGGPTKMVSHALVGATPLLQPSIFGERVDQLVITSSGWLIGFLINVITTAVEQSITWSVEGFLLAVHGFLIFLDAIVLKKRELPGGRVFSQILKKLIHLTEAGLSKTSKDEGSK